MKSRCFKVENWFLNILQFIKAFRTSLEEQTVTLNQPG